MAYRMVQRAGYAPIRVKVASAPPPVGVVVFERRGYSISTAPHVAGVDGYGSTEYRMHGPNGYVGRWPALRNAVISLLWSVLDGDYDAASAEADQVVG